ncbi:MAG: pyridoxal-phosphate dependent enzyme [Chloroflexi bacterium]|nr:pyridoxal-phosphate dependent enzyme [Chloroflexota bacterium]
MPGLDFDLAQQGSPARLAAVPRLQLAGWPTVVDDVPRLAAALGWSGPLRVKRDDAASFAFGGNKVRKMEFYAAAARAAGADTLVTIGGLQSNHARVVAATAARLGMACTLVTNGTRPDVTTANALLDELLGAGRVFVADRGDREPAMARVVADLEARGKRPFAIPLGASTGLGALGFVAAAGELFDQGPAPQLIVHAASTGGTTAGLLVGCALRGVATRILAVSADEPSGVLRDEVRRIVVEIAEELDVVLDVEALLANCTFTDAYVGEGYGIPTEASTCALRLCARTEALFLDPTYTAKAMAALVDVLRDGRLEPGAPVVFWHTGGQVGLFR